MQEKIGYPDNILNDTYLTQENKGVSGTSSAQFNVSQCFAILRACSTYTYIRAAGDGV